MTDTLIRFLKSHPRLLLWCTISLTALALMLTLIPADYLTQNDLWSYDKIGHLLLFGGWTFILGLYLVLEYPGNSLLWKILVTGILFGGIIELLQLLLPVNRYASLGDFLADAIGALLAVLLLRTLLPFFKD